MKKLIGISTNYTTVETGKFLGMERIYLNKNYVDAIEKAGATPLLIPPVQDAESIGQYVNLCDGFILSGGGDINPLLYNCSPHPKLEAIHTGLDKSQWILTEKIIASGKPLLGICRGVQLLNVVLGGTLYQDMDEVPFRTILHSQYSPAGDKFHEIAIVKESVLGELYGEKITVNSFHHQSIKELGQELEIIATSEDGIIEAVKHKKNNFVVGVQWHPEMLLTASDEMLPLFQKLIEHC